MALKAATFTGFETCELSLVQVSDRELGHGSYATVLELEYMGLKCAGKKIHELLLKQGDISYAIFRFEKECRLLSQIRHPNIVQFLGVYFQEGVQVPILVMEFLSTNLTSCIEQYSILPKEISYSILHDVALGLCYLHSQMPPIIHRDLSSNNVLLTPNMTAKISDLGVARILELTSLQASHMTQTPGTPAYMPPEVMIANPKYDTSVDEFSYGIMMIHVLSGRWPEPQVGPVHTEFQTGKMIPVSEAERRNVFLQDIGKDHLLMNLILKCIDNCPQARAGALELVEQLADAVSRFPPSFANKVEMLRRIERDEAEKRSLIYEGERKNRAISEAEDQITIYREEIRAKEKQKAVGISQVRAAYSTELEQLHLHVEDLRVQLQMLKAEKEAEVAELKSQIEICEAELDNKDNSLLLEQKRIIKERKLNQQLVGENHELKLEITNLKTMIHSLQHTSGLNEAIIARKESQLQARISALQEKDSILSTMTTLLTRARECLAAQQVLRARMSWKSCAELPTSAYVGKATVIDGKVYYSGGTTENIDDQFVVYCYDQVQDDWTPLPSLPVRWFGLGQIKGKLVAIGGKRRCNGKAANEGYVFDEQSQKWMQMIPSMPTARHSPGVLSLESALVVACGDTSFLTYTNVVEIFKADTSQWYRTDSLPTDCMDVSMVAIDSICYVLGGCVHLANLNQVLYASVDDLLHNAVPLNQTMSPSSDRTSAWKALSSTSTYRSTAAILAGNLFAFGGKKSSEQASPDNKEVYAYSPAASSWIYVGDLPAARSRTVVAVLSSTEILVIGGHIDGCGVNTVYKGTLHLML